VSGGKLAPAEDEGDEEEDLGFPREREEGDAHGEESLANNKELSWAEETTT